VTVLLADGWRYRDATVSLDKLGAGLWVLRNDGAERLVPIDRVTRIVGPDGLDITGRVFSGERGPGIAVLPPEQADAVVAAPAELPLAWDGAAAPAATAALAATERLMKLAFTLEGGWGSPFGDWFGGNETSWSAGARLRIGTVNRSYLGVGARYQHFESSVFGHGDEQRHAMVYEGTFGWMSRPSAGGTTGYLELGGALLRTVVDYSDLEDRPDHSHTASTGAFVLRAGLMVPLGGAISLDMGGSAVFRGLLFKPDDEEEAALLALHLGLTWHN
jgi:hypothetical protein